MGIGSNKTSIRESDFASLMDAVGPFERRPHIAAAVSGGGDSMALCLLGDRWARERGGRVTALIVDHRLRPESAGEAALVRRWLAARNIPSHVLAWAGPKPQTGVQAAARAARYDAMASWCQGAGVLHLLVGHTLEDQAETYLMRLDRGSGVDGLAGISAIRELPQVRLVRPLLGVGRGRLRAVLGEYGQDWIEDPSNRNTRFARTKARALLAQMDAAGLGPEKLARTAQGYARARTALEDAAASLLARYCRVHPAGYAVLGGGVLKDASEEVALRALSRVVLCIGGRVYAPGAAKVERLFRHIQPDGMAKGRTLGGCRVFARDGNLVIEGENRRPLAPLGVDPGSRVWWDGKFWISIAHTGPGQTHRATDAIRLGRLHDDGWRQVVKDRPHLRGNSIPHGARLGLPALMDGAGVFHVPHLGYRRAAPAPPGTEIAQALFTPRSSMAGMGFFVADQRNCTISKVQPGR